MSVARRAGVLIAAGLLYWAAWIGPAQAHWADQAVATITVDGAWVQVALTIPTGLLAFADEDHNGQISAVEATGHRVELETILGHRLRLTDGRTHGELVTLRAGTTPARGGLASATHSTLLLTYRWPAPLRALTIEYDLFEQGVPTASCLATVVWGGRVRSAVFTPEHRTLSLTSHQALDWRQGVGFVALGIRHILTGYDHVLFLISLLLAGGGFRSLVKVITAFTIAHSVTLSLAALHVVALPPRWVESAIAASIVYVAVRNLRGPQATSTRSSWRVTFAFGLVHGLGFASALIEHGLSGTNLITGLLGFNLGVEAGQLAVITVAFLTLQRMQDLKWVPAFRRWASAGVAVTGMVWLIQRISLAS